MQLQQTVRELLKDKVTEYESIVAGALERYRTTFNEETIALGAFAIDNLGKNTEEIPIFDEPLRRRELLSKKNHLLLSLSIHFISGEVEI
jgi:hypothetical protein